MMSRKQYLGLVAAFVVCSLVGSSIISFYVSRSSAVVASGDAIRTSKIELVNSEGNIQGMFHVDSERGPELVLRGSEQSKVVIGIDMLGSPQMTLYNLAGNPQMVLGLDDFGGEIVVSSPENERMVEIYVDETAFGVVEVLNRSGEGKQLNGR